MYSCNGGQEAVELEQPMSPGAQFLKSSAMSLTILAVMESEIPVDDSNAMQRLKDVFLPINPRFSSIMVTDCKGKRKWRRVEVDLTQHVHAPIFPSDMSVDYYDECFTQYLANLGARHLPENRPLWEIHYVKYPTRNCAGNIVFKLHHSLGDGYSLMGALLSCLRRLDDPSKPLTFPSRRSNDDIVMSSFKDGAVRGFSSFVLPTFFRRLGYTGYDLLSGLAKSFGWAKDDESPIRSGAEDVEFRPIVTTTTSFSIDQIRHIKTRLKVTINDVVTGIITYGTRLYMEKTSLGSGKSKCTALVLLNTRALGGYKSVREMIKPDADMPWGNHFTFIQVPIPELTANPAIEKNPLNFVARAREIIKRQRNSASVILTGQLIDIMRKIKGHEAAARIIHGTLKNTSMAISNIIGPIEKMALDDMPIKGLYFAVAGAPQSLSVTMISYVDKLRIAITAEKDFIDVNKFKSCVERAFDAIFEAALSS